MDVKQRLKQYLDAQGMSQLAFCNAIGVSSAYISNMRKSISPDKIHSIANSFPNLNITWLLTGQGSMLNDEKLPTPDVSAQNSIVGDQNHHNNVGTSDDGFLKGIISELRATIADLRSRCSTYEQQNQELQRLLEEEKKRNIIYPTNFVNNN